jgi:hypothetical protein
MFLDRQQRYALFNGKEIDVVGVSVPVWHYQGQTSEPGNEVFVKYKLYPTEYKIFVKHNEEGYEIYLPHKSFNPEDNRTNPLTLKNLLDHRDGGIEWIAFRQFGKAKKNKKIVNIIHFVEIKTIEELMKTIS